MRSTDVPAPARPVVESILPRGPRRGDEAPRYLVYGVLLDWVLRLHLLGFCCRNPLNGTDSPFARPDIILEHPLGPYVLKSPQSSSAGAAESALPLHSPMCSSHGEPCLEKAGLSFCKRVYAAEDVADCSPSTAHLRRPSFLFCNSWYIRPAVSASKLGTPTHPTFEAGMSRTRNVANVVNNLKCTYLISILKIG